MTTSAPATGAAAADSTSGGIHPHVLLNAKSPSISIETVGPQKIKLGVVAAYTVIVHNAGADAEELTVSIKVPEGAEVVNTSPSEGTMRPGTAEDGAPTVEWFIPHLRAPGKAELALRLIPRKSHNFDLAVHWHCAPIGSSTQIEVQESKLVMTLTGPEEVFYGERELYKLTLSNPGNGDAENVLVRLLPTTPGDDQAVSHQIGTLRAGENKVVELELTARQVGSLRLKAEATADNGLHTTVDEEVIVRRADLKIEIGAPELLYAGTAGDYHIRVTNPGNAAAKNIQIAALLPSGAKYLSSTEEGTYSQEQGRIQWSVATLRPGAQWSCTFRCELGHPGANAIQVVGSADGDLRQIASASSEVEALADLAMTIKDPTGPVPVGQDANYEIHITNRGSKSAEGVEVVAFFSPGIEPTKVDGGQHEIGPGQISMAPIASLAPGEEVTFTIRARAHRSGNHVFRAEVMCPDLETKLAAEETTRFYGEAVPDSSPEPATDAAAVRVDPMTPQTSDESLVPTTSP